MDRDFFVGQKAPTPNFSSPATGDANTATSGTNATTCTAIPQPTVFPISGTKVTSPYPPNLTPGEHRLVFSLQRHFAPDCIFADCYLPKADPNRTPAAANRFSNQALDFTNRADLTQIDCLAIGPGGVFVFESKDRCGWIYGHGNRRMWTQVTHYGRKKFQFYNPVKQNRVHISALRGLVSRNIPVYSIIVFGLDSEIKVAEELPAECYVCTQVKLHDLIWQLEAKTSPLPPELIYKLAGKIQAGRVLPTTEIRDTHVTEILETTGEMS